MQSRQGMLVVLLSEAEHSSKTSVPVLSAGPTDTWEQSLLPTGVPGHKEFARRGEEMQRQAEGVNPALHSSKTLQEASEVTPNKAGASKALVSTQRGRRQVPAASETDPAAL